MQKKKNEINVGLMSVLKMFSLNKNRRKKTYKLTFIIVLLLYSRIAKTILKKYCFVDKKKNQQLL